MSTYLFGGVVVAMLATLGVLVMGVVNLIQRKDPARSNRLMQSRVLLQLTALILLALVMLLARK